MESSHDRRMNYDEKGIVEPAVQRAGDAKEQSTAHRTGILNQKLDRYLNFIPTLAFGANLQASWESVVVSFQAGLLNGGPTGLIYGTIIAWIGSTAIAMSLAEMASINPTVGAQYHWTGLYAPPGFMSPAFWGLLQGWITVFAWIATVAQPAYLLGTTVQGLIITSNDTYQPQRWQGTLLAWAFLLIPVLCNIFARKVLAPLELVGGVTHIVFFLVWIIALLALAPKSSADFVFATTYNGAEFGGWPNTGVSWCVGLLSAVFPLGGFDGVLHMSDEVKDAERKVPRSMICSVIINGAMGLIMMVVVLFCLGDPVAALTTPTGYPIIEVLLNATNSKAGTIVLMAMPTWNGVIAMFSSLASVSRLTWAFARDRGLPFPHFFGAVHPTLRIPLNSLAFITTIIALLQLINIGSSAAFFAILSLSTLALYISYLLPIVFVVLTKLRGAHIPYGPFKLGRWGLPINLFSIVYATFIIIWLPFPSFMPVTAVNMNYGGPVMGAVLIWAIVDWLMWGKKRFVPPTEKYVRYE